MNINDVSKRETLDFQDFKKMVHDEQYKPLSPKNQKDSSEKTGLSKVKRNPAFDFVGYADSVFGKESHIDVPGYNSKGKRRYDIQNAAPSIVNSPNTASFMGESKGDCFIMKLNEFNG